MKQGEKLVLEALKQMHDDQHQSYEPALSECLFLQHRYAEAEPQLLNQYRALRETQHPDSPRLKKVQDHLQTIANFKLRID